MGSIQNCACCLRNRQLIIPLIFLLISNFSNSRFMVEGRAISNLVGSVSKLIHYPPGREEEEVVVVAVAVAVAARRRLIGSRPPRCERRCSSCGHCEAIQVPIAPKLKKNHVASSRADDISNYKPICWMCKCGDFIFNP
ncbi:hypothetical protein ACSBR1_000717 [Camellia fascicularis]